MRFLAAALWAKSIIHRETANEYLLRFAAEECRDLFIEIDNSSFRLDQLGLNKTNLRREKMFSFFKKSVIDKDVRDWLTANGYQGKQAEIIQSDLYAIARPGWLQIYRFSTKAPRTLNDLDSCEHDSALPLETAPQILMLFGVMKSDQRHGRPQIKVFNDVSKRDELLSEWSQNLIIRRR